MLLGLCVRQFSLLQDFRCGLLLSDLKQPDRAVYPLRALTSFIGRNNSGKSQILDALAFLADCQRYPLAYAANLYQRGGFRRLQSFGSSEDVCFEVLLLAPWHDELLSYDLRLAVDSHGRPEVKAERLTARFLSEEIAAELRGLGVLDARAHEVCAEHERGHEKAPAAEEERCCFTLEQDQVRLEEGGESQIQELGDRKRTFLSSFGRLLHYRRIHACYQALTGIYCLRPSLDEREARAGTPADEQGEHRHLNEHATNIRHVLRYLKQEDEERYRRIQRRIARRMPRMQHVDDHVLDWSLRNAETKLYTLLLLLEDPRPRPLILLDNPDTGLHHDMVEELGRALRDYSLLGERQVILSTHSSILLEAFCPEEVWTLRRAKPHGVSPGADTAASAARQEGSRASCIAESELVRAMYEEGIGLGALWYSGQLEDGDTDEDDSASARRRQLEMPYWEP